MVALFLIAALCSIAAYGLEICEDLALSVDLRVVPGGGGNGRSPGADSLDPIESYLTHACLGACIKKKASNINNGDKTASCNAVGQQPDLTAIPTKMGTNTFNCEWTDLTRTRHPGYRATCLPRHDANNRYQLQSALQMANRFGIAMYGQCESANKMGTLMCSLYTDMDAMV